MFLLASFADPSSPINPLNWEFPPSILFLTFSLLSVYYPRAKSSTPMCSVTIYKLPWTQILPPEAPPELQGGVSTACKMFPSACPKVKPKVLIFLHKPIPAFIFTVSINVNNQQDQVITLCWSCRLLSQSLPCVPLPPCSQHVHVCAHTHTCTRAPHVIGQEACVTFPCCPVW